MQRLLNAQTSPFGVALTPVQCIPYALTRPAVAAIVAGFDNSQHAFSTGQCTYCGHCTPCPKEIDIAMVNKLWKMQKFERKDIDL